MVLIIDYGMGNIHSVQKAIEAVGQKTIVGNSPSDLQKAEKVIFPGVGAFSDAMANLKETGLAQAITDYIQKGGMLLGICLGMQLLFEESEESPNKKGLGIFKGRVLRFPRKNGLKIPHMGWNQLKIVKNDCPLLSGINPGSFVYFCHSFYPDPKDKDIIAASTEHGRDFASVLWKGNCFGVQFHPEKSQSVGRIILNNFLKL